ncbi:MAG: sn-glycerol-3-phosphate ABC transporter ATP-binding protein UgpC [Rudaea sp.]|uniref:ABC transporter ATP-binding protein n=1 Tax=Rudaea sp. TaxID=2136325 RepID=UPI0039E61BFC
MAVVTLRNLCKLYPGGHAAVKDFSLEVGDGEFVVFVGPSGCGKSTTLRMIAGLEEISSGELAIDGKPANGFSPKARDVAMVFQNYALYPHMTVRENMGFALRLAGVARPEIARRVLGAAQTLQLETLLERKPAALSGGQRQRVALGRALVREPKVFLMDEPLSNLDAKLRAEMRASISRLQRRLGATTIYVTHDQVEAMTMGDRIVVMRDGEIQQVAAPIELYERPANKFVAGFIGSPAMSFLSVRAQADALAGDGFRLPMPAALRARFDLHEAQDLWLGVRPEALDAVGVDSAGGRLRGVVDVVEPLGAETVVGVVVGAERVIARLAGHHVLRAGEAIELALDAQRLHLFDRASERSLRRAA